MQLTAMTLSCKLSTRFQLLPCSFARTFLPRSQKIGSICYSNCRRFDGVFLRQISRRLEICGVDFHSEGGIVLPASEEHVKEAVEAIKAGLVIAVPTDTLYGFACDACSEHAVNQIYEIKGRKLTSPLAISVGDVSDISQFAVVDHLPPALLRRLLPGPVTIILKRGESSILEKSLNPGLDSIGVRVPDSKFIRSIACGSESALALTSANISGGTSSTSIQDFQEIWRHCAFVYDGGFLPSGRAGSTIVDLRTPMGYKILRAGSARDETCAVLEEFGWLETA